MPDTIGTISVPDFIITSNVFPLYPTFPFSTIHNPIVVEHLIDNTSANRKISQRFYVGPNARMWTFGVDLTKSRRDALRNFWEARSGPYEAFLFNSPNPDQTTTQVTVTFKNEPLSWQQLTNQIASSNLTLIELPSTNPSYSISSTQTRLPSGSLASGLLSQVQEIIPLVKITSKQSGYPVMYLSDRRCIVGGQQYLPRLLPQGWEGIEQGLDGSSDSARFVFGNADRVMKSVAASTNLWKASVEFSFYHVGSSIKLDVWKGDVIDIQGAATDTFSLLCSDGLYDLGILYPRPITRSCWKTFNDGINCPASGSGGTNLSTPCDKGFNTPQGCVFHNMQRYHGGILAEPQLVRIKDNSTGVWGYSRNNITASSIIGDSVYEQALPEVYTDEDMPIPARIIAGRDESDFYAALGIVCAGPVQFKANDFTSSPQITPHLLDGQPPHGAVSNPPKNNWGWRYAQGFDPALTQDKFSLGEGGSGPQTYANIYAAGVAFAEIRRGDEKGIQLTKLDEHSMQVTISQGLSGWKWTGPGSRSSVTLTNYIWIMINLFLKAKGLWSASAATQEQYFDVNAAIAAASIHDQVVNKLVGSGTETQLKCKAIFQERRAVRQWLDDLCLSSLSNYTFIFGKLKLITRVNSSVVEAWTSGNIIADSLDLTLLSPQYNDLTTIFANEDFDYISDSQRIYHEDHVNSYGRSEGQLNLFGCCNRSQALRVGAIKLREEIGGINETQYLASRNLTFRTTILGLHAEPGMVCSLTHPDVPNGSVEFRVERVRINNDFSVDISGRTTTDEMYDLLAGPKPVDVEPSEIPSEAEFAPADWSYEAYTDQRGNLKLRNFNCATNSGSVLRGHFSIYYIDEAIQHTTHLLNNLSTSTTSFQYTGDPLTVGDLILIRGEILKVTAVTPTSPYNGTATVERAQLGTSAAAHSAVTGTVGSVSSVSTADFTTSAGLDIEPGDNIVRVVPAGNSGVVGNYISGSGQVNALLPFSTLAAGNIVQFQQRVYIVKRRDEVVHFQPRFFKSPARVNFEHSISLPFAGVVGISGVLENSVGLRSEAVDINFTSGAFPHRLRTLGTTVYKFFHAGLAVNPTTQLNLFESVRVNEPQSLTNASAEITGGLNVGEPIQSPGAPTGITLGDYTDGGQIIISGTPTAGDQIWVTFGSGSERVFLQIPPFTVTTETTATQVATNLRDWLNGGEEFRAYYDAVSLTGSTINIVDMVGVGGTIEVVKSGSIGVSADGMDSNLGLNLGRRYAVSFRDSSTPLESELSPLSLSTGPSGGATEVTIRQIPISADSRVNQRRIWATPDGKDSPFYLIGTLTNNTATELTDTIPESSLASQTPWSGSSQPTTAGAVKMLINRDGVGYCELRIDQNRSMSNVLHGLALPPLAEGNLLTVDVTNQAGEIDLFIALQ